MDVNSLKDLIVNYNNIVFFGGVGVLIEFNILDFRSFIGLFS